MARSASRGAPEAGTSWRLVGPVAGIDLRPGHAVVRVREVVPAAEPGANAFGEGGAEAVADLTHRQRTEWLSAGFELEPAGAASTAAQRRVSASDSGGTGEDQDAMAARHTEEYAAAAAPFQVDAVVVEWDEPTPVWNGSGYDVGSLVRAWSTSVDEFYALFEEA